MITRKEFVDLVKHTDGNISDITKNFEEFQEKVENNITNIIGWFKYNKQILESHDQRINDQEQRINTCKQNIDNLNKVVQRIIVPRTNTSRMNTNAYTSRPSQYIDENQLGGKRKTRRKKRKTRRKKRKTRRKKRKKSKRKKSKRKKTKRKKN
tara:strand:- start:3295 stop:3753 length:459 start_codon:yes stop_codon:yes gene_type:complete